MSGQGAAESREKNREEVHFVYLYVFIIFIYFFVLSPSFFLRNFDVVNAQLCNSYLIFLFNIFMGFLLC